MSGHDVTGRDVPSHDVPGRGGPGREVVRTALPAVGIGALVTLLAVPVVAGVVGGLVLVAGPGAFGGTTSALLLLPGGAGAWAGTRRAARDWDDALSAVVVGAVAPAAIILLLLALELADGDALPRWHALVTPVLGVAIGAALGLRGRSRRR